MGVKPRGMAIRGRKPRPKATKTPQIAAKKGLMAPDFLSREAKAEWKRIAPSLDEAGLLSEIDRGPLAAYCQMYARWLQAERALAKARLTTTTTNGNLIQHPMLGIANRAMELMTKAAAEFGMTPSSRSRIDIGREEPEDPFERFVREKLGEAA